MARAAWRKGLPPDTRHCYHQCAMCQQMMGKASYLRGSLHRMHSTPTWPRASRIVPRHRVSPSMKRLPLHPSRCLPRTQPPTSTRSVSTGMPVQILERQNRGGQAQPMSARASHKQSPRRRQREREREREREGGRERESERARETETEKERHRQRQRPGGDRERARKRTTYRERKIQKERERWEEGHGEDMVVN